MAKPNMASIDFQKAASQAFGAGYAGDPPGIPNGPSNLGNTGKGAGYSPNGGDHRGLSNDPPPTSGGPKGNG